MVGCMLQMNCKLLLLIRRAIFRCLHKVVGWTVAFRLHHFVFDGSVLKVRNIVLHWSVASGCCAKWLSRTGGKHNYGVVWMGRSVDAGREDCPNWLRLVRLGLVGADGRELVRRAGGDGFHFDLLLGGSG